MTIESDLSPARANWPGWVLLGTMLLCASLAMRWSSGQFGHQAELPDMPILALVGAYCGAGAVIFVCLPRLIRSAGQHASAGLIAFMVIAGLVMRLVQFGAEPVLEDDYNRYLWDGAVTAAGANPYAASPEGSHGLSDLKARAGVVFERINYPEYRTVYPPVAQAAFVISHWVAPFSLDGWRGLLMVLELAGLALIMAILQRLSQPVLWAGLYWWNPVAIKEIANSAHVEPVLVLPVLLGVYLVLAGRPVWSTAMLAIAAGVKIWPALLALPVLRQLLNRPVRLAAAMAVGGMILAAQAWPILAAGIGDDSGFVAYAQKWRASSAAFLASDWVTSVTGVASAARGLLALMLVFAIAVICRTRAAGEPAVVLRLFLISAAVCLLSPSMFPWYFLWVLPFLCFYPVRGLLLLGVLMPFHYLYFHFAARDLEDIYNQGIVWLIWLPVWAVLAYDAGRALAGRRPSGLIDHAART